jgi:hypothetical protein
VCLQAYEVNFKENPTNALVSIKAERKDLHIQYSRVTGWLSIPLNWLPPPPSPLASVCPPTWILRGGGDKRLWRKGWGEPIQATGQKLWHSEYKGIYIYIAMAFHRINKILF